MFFFSIVRLGPASTLFPYTTSSDLHGIAAACVLAVLPGAMGALLGLALLLLGLAAAWSRALLRSRASVRALRAEEHTSELQSLRHLVCRLLLEKKKSPV